MPANLTPQYREAEERYKKATSNQEKLTALEEMLRIIPKHKGTEKIQADLKRRISRLRRESRKKPAATTQKPFHYIGREGAGQVVVCGPPNSGKSLLVDRLTAAEPEVADYPFTTRVPLPGMMAFEDIQIQLVDTPPLAPETLEPWQLAQIEQADVGLLLFDVNDAQLLDQTEFVLDTFHDRNIRITTAKPPRILVLGNKIDLDPSLATFQAWRELFGKQFEAEPLSLLSDHELEQLRSRIFGLLQVVRVYTKAPGKKFEENPTPYVLGKGATVLDAAAAVHKELAAGFKYARIWAEGSYQGQMVERDHILEDGDLLEFHESGGPR